MPNQMNQIILATLAITAFIALNACNGSVVKYKAYPVPIIDAFEKPPKGEKANIEKIAAIQAELHKMRYAKVNARKLRNVHPKAHGCVNATFTIDENIKKEFQVGLFSQPHTFNVKIRYSNASARIGPDGDPKIGKAGSRGMAIQIPNVKGTVIKVPGETGTQDFLMINQPVFAIKDVKDYLELTENQLKDEKKAVLNFITKPGRKREAQIVKSIVTTKLANPLEAQYFSAAPFLFGKDRVMKFSAKPCENPPEQKIPENPSDDYLRQAMNKHLDWKNGKEACFNFYIQVGKEGGELGIEDATFEWIDKKSLIGDFPGKSEKGIPYEKVAQIIIPKQKFDTRENDEACEKLELNPWHSLVEHQPLGGINRLRNPVYLESAKGRK